jgi:pilus assembly protein Flp/PilA
MRWIATFLRAEQAATSVEYAVMLALILVTVMAAIGAVGAKSGGMWGGIANSVNTITPSGP